MRSKSMLRPARPIYLGAGAVVLAVPATAVALSTAGAAAPSPIHATVTPHRAPFGHSVSISGGALSTPGGERLQLEFAPGGSRVWQTLGSTVASPHGAYRFTTLARRSGLLRVVPATAPATGASGVGAARVARAGAGPAQKLTVSARFQLGRQALTVVGARRAHIRGRLLPALAGRRVVLAARSGGGWRPVAAARTNDRGGFMLSVGAPAGPRHSLRVLFAGDRANAPTNAAAGSITAAQPDLASWYDDAGATACGFHAFYGVANRTLPCGTHVTFTIGGRSVQATVDDRGPFVGGRNWDLNQNTAGALGFGGVGTVWVSF